MPLYYAILTGLALFFPITANQKSSLFFEYIYLTNYTRFFKDPQVMGWAWSLCVEEHFYFTVPILLLLLARMRTHAGRLVTLGLAWSSCLAIKLGMLYGDPTIRDPAQIFPRMYLPTHTRFDTLVAGIFLAYVQYNFGDELKRFFARRAARLSFYAMAFLGFYVLMSKHIFWGDTYLWNVLTWGSVTSITYVTLILPLINSDGIAQRILGSRVMYLMATLSYGIYLLHVPICERWVVPIARSIHAPFALVWPVSVLLLVGFSTALAYVLHLLIEKPFLRLRERIAR
jgi:peptidoglycan/LPS O-acetylase OafA/YrhL